MLCVLRSEEAANGMAIFGYVLLQVSMSSQLVDFVKFLKYIFFLQFFFSVRKQKIYFFKYGFRIGLHKYLVVNFRSGARNLFLFVK